VLLLGYLWEEYASKSTSLSAPLPRMSSRLLSHSNLLAVFPVYSLSIAHSRSAFDVPASVSFSATAATTRCIR